MGRDTTTVPRPIFLWYDLMMYVKIMQKATIFNVEGIGWNKKIG